MMRTHIWSLSSSGGRGCTLHSGRRIKTNTCGIQEIHAWGDFNLCFHGLVKINGVDVSKLESLSQEAPTFQRKVECGTPYSTSLG